MTAQFNPPPDWPEPPRQGWSPPDGWQPDAGWGGVPAGWRTWVEQEQVGTTSPLLASEDVPASGARLRPRTGQYPVEVLNPGMWTDNHLEDEDYGFPTPRVRRDRPRLRLAMTILATVLGLVVATLTVLLFVRLEHVATTDLPAVSSASSTEIIPTTHVGSAQDQEEPRAV